MNLEIKCGNVAVGEIRIRDLFEVTIALGQVLRRVLALRHRFQASTSYDEIGPSASLAQNMDRGSSTRFKL
jgi:hypothetical protein